jgi:hypothetical protein
LLNQKTVSLFLRKTPTNYYNILPYREWHYVAPLFFGHNTYLMLENELYIDIYKLVVILVQLQYQNNKGDTQIGRYVLQGKPIKV